MNNQKCILAIDPATKTGWAITDEYFGVLTLKKPSEKIKDGLKWQRMLDFLESQHKLCGFDIIAVERPGGRNVNAVIHQSKIIAAIEMFAYKYDIELLAFSAKQIKKFATGNGNANKIAMIDAAKRKFRYSGKNDNEADALWILQYAKSVIDGEQI